jgi:hypothetical protein
MHVLFGILMAIVGGALAVIGLLWALGVIWA